MLLTGFSESKVMRDKRYALKVFNAMLEEHKAKHNTDYNYKVKILNFDSDVVTFLYYPAGGENWTNKKAEWKYNSMPFKYFVCNMMNNILLVNADEVSYLKQ